MAKTIGIFGGTTPESTALYYLYITRSYYKQFGDYGFPQIIIHSVNFQKYLDAMENNRWDEITENILTALSSLKNGGSDFALIATNTMHLVFPQIQERSPIPLVSIIDAAGSAIQKRKIGKVALLGTRFTMNEPFYREGLASWGIKTIVPEENEQQVIHRIIFDELGKALLQPSSRECLQAIIDRLVEQGAQGIVLACTELPLLIQPEDSSVPVFDTALIHAETALQYALSKDPQ